VINVTYNNIGRTKICDKHFSSKKFLKFNFCKEARKRREAKNFPGHARRREDEPCVHALACCGVLESGDGETPDLLKFPRRVLKKYIKKNQS
jgi:hypothetical protein